MAVLKGSKFDPFFRNSEGINTVRSVFLLVNNNLSVGITIHQIFRSKGTINVKTSVYVR